VPHNPSIRIFTPTIFFLICALTILSRTNFSLRVSGFQSDLIPQNNSVLQKSVDRAMENHPGTFVVVDVASGKILASNNLRLAATTLQTPGSTLKPFVLMTLLDLHRVDPAQKLLCKRKLQIGSERLDCTHPISISELNADDAIAYSCNSYFAQVSIRLSSAELVQAFRRAGFDSPSSLVDNDATGNIRTPSNPAQIQLAALGDQGIEVTPLELLAAYRKLALRKRNGDIGTYAPIFDGLQHSVEYGMAHAGKVDDMNVAGKTGTAASRNNPHTHGFFVGYAPAEKPEIAVVVFVQQGRGLDAAAIAQSVFKEYAQENRGK
jgi:cell division protein FtsI/penicillin-binding protein 2